MAFLVHTWRYAAVGVLCFAAGLGVSYGLRGDADNRTALGKVLRDTDTDYAYVKPLLACSVDASRESLEFAPLRDALASVIATAKASDAATTVSLYYRDLDTAMWTAIDGDDAYYPASLMKVPIMLVYLKLSESDPTILEDTMTLENDSFSAGHTQEIVPSERVEIGTTYTVSELLRLMIVHSDNIAMAMLMNYLDADVLTDMLDDLGAPLPSDTYAISARQFSRFFRILYNGTWLSEVKSEEALRLLVASEYRDALAAGVPDTVAVAHKFGESSVELVDGRAGKALNDCGIVYAESPYVLCVMSQGPMFDGLAATIAELNRAAYEFSTQ